MASAVTSGRRHRTPRIRAAEGSGTGTSAQVFWDSSSTLLAVVDPDLCVHEVNPAWTRALGIPTDDLVNGSLLELVHPDDTDLVRQRWSQGFGDGTLRPVQVRLHGAEGRVLTVSFTGTVHEGRWYLAGRDAARHLEVADTRGEGPAGTAWTQDALLDEIGTAVVAMDHQDRVTHWNRAAERLFAVPREEAVGTPVHALVRRVGTAHPEHPSPPPGDRLTPGGSREVLRRRDGSVVTAHVRNTPLLGRDGEVIGSISVCLDVTPEIRAEREAVEARNHLRAVTDSMGEGLFALDGEGRVTVMNAAAEELLGWSLAEVQGQRIHEVIHHRHPDGTSFPADDCPLERVHRDGVTLRLAADTFIRRDGLDLPVTFTAAPLETREGPHGCVVVFIDATEVHAAQQRLAEELHELAWVQRVQQALEEDRFELYAQPILNLATGDVTQCELLLRVRGKDGSVEPPSRYLSTAEEHGLIGDVDRWVIRRSLELAATGMHVELNISASSVGDPQLLADIEAWLAASGADPRLVVFEITETALIRDEAAGRVFVERLHELGCKVALDDFGTGYGGFTYLKQLPVHYLKIDIEFVRDLCDNQASRHVVQAVVNLAHGFGLETVAEGVEDQRTLDLLEQLGVDFAQGYHVGRPAPLA